MSRTRRPEEDPYQSITRTIGCLARDSRIFKMTLEAIKYDGKGLMILNQLLLPSQTVYEELKTLEDAWNAIRNMKV